MGFSHGVFYVVGKVCLIRKTVLFFDKLVNKESRHARQNNQ